MTFEYTKQKNAPGSGNIAHIKKNIPDLDNNLCWHIYKTYW